MDKNMFLAIALSMLVIIAYYALFPPQPPPKQEESAPAGPVATEQGQTGLLQSETPPAATASTPPTDGAAPALLSGGERQIEVKTPNYVARIDRRGGTLASMVLDGYQISKDHIDWADVLPPLRSMLPKNTVDTDAKVEMINLEIPGARMLGVAFEGNAGLTESFARLPYRADTSDVELGAGDGPRTIVLEGAGPEGITVRKLLRFHPDSYIVDYELQVINYSDVPRNLRVQPWFGQNLLQMGHEQYRAHIGPIYQADGSVDTEDADDIEGQLLVRTVDWMGMTDNYFLTAVKPDTPISYGIYRSKLLSPPEADERWGSYYGMELPAVELLPRKMISSTFQMYIGPKHVGEMRKFDDQLENSLDLTLDVLARPLLAMLRWFHTYVGNYGIAIILLTIVVRVGLFPLTYKGMVAMKRMQKLQPKMAGLRDKHKNDKERLNKEMMEMYRRHKVNPLGGCLPIALQIPIFFALYSALLGAIELRHSPFFLWIVDLSDRNPLYVTPLLMGASMFFQQRLTPTTLDPTQAKIMMWMPVIFTVFMVNFPSGLVLYWLTSNTLSIAQQLIINRIQVPEPTEQDA